MICNLLTKIRIAQNKEVSKITEGDKVICCMGFVYPTTVHSIYYNSKGEKMLRHKHQFGNYLVTDYAQRYKLL